MILKVYAWKEKLERGRHSKVGRGVVWGHVPPENVLI